eukprot:4709089-Amphidinium_carterae.1
MACAQGAGLLVMDNSGQVSKAFNECSCFRGSLCFAAERVVWVDQKLNSRRFVSYTSTDEEKVLRWRPFEFQVRSIPHFMHRAEAQSLAHPCKKLSAAEDCVHAFTDSYAQQHQ